MVYRAERGLPDERGHRRRASANDGKGVDNERPQQFSGPVDVSVPNRFPLIDQSIVNQSQEGIVFVYVAVDSYQGRRDDERWVAPQVFDDGRAGGFQLSKTGIVRSDVDQAEIEEFLESGHVGTGSQVTYGALYGTRDTIP